MARRRGVLLAALLAALVLVLLRLFVAAVYAIPSPSMVPTLLVGDRVLVRLGAFETLPARGEIVVFRRDGVEHVKRVIGLPGERIAIVDRQVVIDQVPLPLEWQETSSRAPEGDVLERPVALARSEVFEEGIDARRHRVLWDRSAPALPQGPWIVPPGQLFVLGDNRTDSSDSRDPSVGFVRQEELVGRVVRVLVSWGPGGLRGGRTLARLR